MGRAHNSRHELISLWKAHVFLAKNEKIPWNTCYLLCKYFGWYEMTEEERKPIRDWYMIHGRKYRE